MDQIIKERQRFVRRVVTDDEARAELAAEPYKLELIGVKGSAAADADGASVEVGGRRADHLRQRPARRLGRLEGPVPRAARAAHRLHPGVRADAHLRRLLAR